MVMDMIFVHMSADTDLVSVKILTRKAIAEFMGERRGDLMRLETLDDVLSLYTVCFYIMPFGVHHGFCGSGCLTSYAGYKCLLFGFIFIDHIPNELISRMVFASIFVTAIVSSRLRFLF